VSKADGGGQRAEAQARVEAGVANREHREAARSRGGWTTALLPRGAVAVLLEAFSAGPARIVASPR